MPEVFAYQATGTGVRAKVFQKEKVPAGWHVSKELALGGSPKVTAPEKSSQAKESPKPEENSRLDQMEIDLDRFGKGQLIRLARKKRITVDGRKSEESIRETIRGAIDGNS